MPILIIQSHSSLRMPTHSPLYICMIISAGAVPRYGLHLSSSQHPCSAHLTPMRPNKLVPVRMRPSLEYHLHFTHCYHPELPHMVIQKNSVRCFGLSTHYIYFFFFFSFSPHHPTLSLCSPFCPPLSLSFSLSLSHDDWKWRAFFNNDVCDKMTCQSVFAPPRKAAGPKIWA